MRFRCPCHPGVMLLLCGCISITLSEVACAPVTSSTPSDSEYILPSDFDGAWRITGETGLANVCVTIIGDRITQLGECESLPVWITDTEPSVRSEDHIIWTFKSSDSVSAEIHTISVFIQSDDTLMGTYSIRQGTEHFPLVDRIIMTRYTLRF